MVTTRNSFDKNHPSPRVLSEIPLRVVTFLWAIHRSAELRGALARGGYTEEDHDEGVRLLAATCSYGQGLIDGRADEETRAALAFLYRWAVAHLSRLRIAVARLHPEHGGLFADLEFSDGGSAAFAISRWLERVETLERRDAKHPESLPVLALLARRGAGPEERSRLAERLAAVQNVSFATVAETDHEQRELLALHQWFIDWSTTARSVVRRKDWLISLGLAERQRRKGGT